MALFRYEALDPSGKVVKGVLDADSENLAKEKLRRDQILVVAIKPYASTKKELKLSPSLLLSFTRELSQLLGSGLPLYEALVTIEEKYRKSSCHPLFLDLCDQIKKGTSFSEALAKYPKTFDEVYTTMVHSAEESGSLEMIFQELTTLLSRAQKLKKQLMGAITYPIFLGIFCVLVLTVLLFFVVPSMQEFFEGRELHPITQIVLSLSRFVTTNTTLIALFLAFFISLIIAFFKNPLGKRFFQRAVFSLPLVNTITLHSALARFSRSCAVLIKGGVPLLDALRLSRQVMHNSYLEEVIERSESSIIQGKSFSGELKNSALIPPLMVRMLAISEETGKMGPMLGNLADIYDEEVEKSLQQLMTFLQPALLLFLGLIVGLVLISILLPLTDVGSMGDNL